MPEQAQNKSSELSDEEKYIKRDHVRNRYGNVPKEDRQKSKQIKIFIFCIVQTVNKAVLNLDDFEVKNITFHSSTYPIDINKIDANK